MVNGGVGRPTPYNTQGHALPEAVRRRPGASGSSRSLTALPAGHQGATARVGLAPTLTAARCSADVVLGLIKPGEQMVIYESFTDSQQNIKLRHDRGERGALFCAELLPAPPSGARGCTRGRQKKRRCCGATTAQRPLRLASCVCVLVGWTPNKSPDGSQVFNVGIEGLEVRTCSRSC